MAGFDQGVGATFFDLNTLQVLLVTQHVHVVQACRIGLLGCFQPLIPAFCYFRAKTEISAPSLECSKEQLEACSTSFVLQVWLCLQMMQDLYIRAFLSNRNEYHFLWEHFLFCKIRLNIVFVPCTFFRMKKTCLTRCHQ